MITKNFKQYSRMLLIGDGPEMETGNVSPGMLIVTGVDGGAYYLRNNATEGIGDYMAYTTNAVDQGVTFGSGTTPATENDYKIEAPISSGLSVTRDLYKTTVTSDKLSAEVHYSATNTSGQPITISEIACKKFAAAALVPNIYGTPVIANSTRNTIVMLVDRTVLDTPVTLQPGDTADFKYILSVDHPNKAKTVNGIKCVPFETGADEEIAAMIDAAHNGLIDLQTDAGWSIGDKRWIEVSGFTDGETTTQSQHLFIEITSFDDYNSCGCVMQFDFYETFNERFNMHANGTDNIGYGQSKMYLVTLPALVEALPSWIKSRLLTFSVLSKSLVTSEIEAVPSNKLALRSLSEVNPTALGVDFGEGSLIAKFNRDTGLYRIKRLIRTADGKSSWSPSYDSGYIFPASRTMGSKNSVSDYNGTSNYWHANSLCICPFGCL